MKNKKLAAWIALGIIAIIAGLALAVTNEITADPIAQQALTQAENARRAVLPEAQSFEPYELGEGATVSNCYIGKSGENVVGYVATLTVSGYGGPVEITVGVNNEKVIQGINVGGSDFSETAGLGAKSKDKAFTDQFIGKTPRLSVIKAGGNKTDQTIDAITAATITSSAVTSGVNTASSFIISTFIEKPVEKGDEVAQGVTVTASRKGYNGPVFVSVTVDENDIVTALTVGNEMFDETDGIGSQVKEDFFTSQFIGKKLPLKDGDIDLITGATISSTAVFNAVNVAFDKIGEARAANATTTVSASKKGYNGPVFVSVEVDNNGVVKSMTVGNDMFDETVGIGSQVKEDWFIAQFIGKTLPLKDGDVDLITGATISSTAVVNAVNAAYDKLAPEAAPASAATAAPTAAPDVTNDGKTAKASRKGYNGPVAVTLTIDENDKIASIVVGDANFDEMVGFGAAALDAEFAARFVGKSLPIANTDVDLITGATVTSEAVIKAINAAYDKILAARGN